MFGVTLHSLLFLFLLLHLLDLLSDVFLDLLLHSKLELFHGLLSVGQSFSVSSKFRENSADVELSPRNVDPTLLDVLFVLQGLLQVVERNLWVVLFLIVTAKIVHSQRN